MKEQNIEQLGEQTLGDKEVHDMISTRAYEIHLSRGGEHGRDVEDWLQAEREVAASMSGEGPLAKLSDTPPVVTTVPNATESQTAEVKRPKSSAAARAREY